MGERAILKFDLMVIKSFISSLILLMLIPYMVLADSKSKDNVSNSDDVFQAVIHSNVSAISRYLLVGDKDIVGSAGMTPLAVAVQMDKREIVNLLIAKGADLSVKNNNEGGLLHLASSCQ